MTPEGGFRCAADALDRGEAMVGTASTVRAFALVEVPGAWGQDAVGDARMPERVRRHLHDLAALHSIRVLLIRDHVRRTTGEVRVFAAYVAGEEPWVQTTVLDDLDAVPDLDLRGLAGGASPGLTPHHDPLFLVCTHGRHDACCAERGRPLAAALHAVAPEDTWEVSHVGGDRFAPNVLVLPDGLYYGRLDPEGAGAFVANHRTGQLTISRLRGRSSFDFRVQAAEQFLRKHTGDRSLAAPLLLSQQREGDRTRVVMRLSGSRWAVVVRTDHAAPQQLTCRAAAPSRALAHELVGLELLHG